MEEIILKMINGTSISLDVAAIIKIAIILVSTAALLIAIKIIYKRIVAKPDIHSDLRKTQVYRISLRVGRIIIITAGVLAILHSIGINLTGLSVLLGIVVILLIMAVKDALADVFAGVVIMSDKYFAVGDAIEFEGKDGVVISFTARTTKIELLDDRSVLSVANRNISKIRKLTHLVDIDLPLPYELSLKEAYSVLSGICMKISGLEGIESCELKGTQDFGASAIIYKIRFFCEPNDRPDIRRAALKTIQVELENASIHIPYQQIDIHEK